MIMRAGAPIASRTETPAELTYEELESEIAAKLAETKLVTLATAVDDRVTARTVSIVSDGLRIFFQTECSSVKSQQIAANENVAVSSGDLRIEGSARQIGRPLDHPPFARRFAGDHEHAFRQFSGRRTTRLFEIRPRRASIWRFDPEIGPHEDFLEIEDRMVLRRLFVPTREWQALKSVGG
jgi:hypothetical protein